MHMVVPQQQIKRWNKAKLKRAEMTKREKKTQIQNRFLFSRSKEVVIIFEQHGSTLPVGF